MEVMKSYDDNGVGIIPQDWGIAAVSELVRKGDGIKIGPFGSQLRKDLLVKRGFKVYGQENVFQKNLEIGNRYLGKSHFITLQSCELTEGDFIVSMMGTIGKTMVMPKSFEKGIMDSHLLRLRLRGDLIDTKFLSHIFESKTLLDQVFKLSVGGIMDGLSSRIVKMILIPLPPLPEQKAIAEVLSDTENLIQSLEKLVEKKRLIKKGVMQELLSPKEGWEEITILQLAENKKQSFDDGDWVEAEHITTEGIRLIQTGNIGVGSYIEKENRKYINEESFVKLKCKEVKEGDLLICRLAEPAGRACVLPNIGENKIITSVDVTIFRPPTEITNRHFLVNVFCTVDWFAKIYENVGGTTHKRISRGALGKIKIAIPVLQEQNRIANILLDIDSEINTLEQKLSKFRMLKSGLMQNLLTGKIRLITY